jgi:hypothetical protein
MISVKKAMFVFFVAAGLAGGIAQARDFEYCEQLMGDCIEGNSASCLHWTRVCQTI